MNLSGIPLYLLGGPGFCLYDIDSEEPLMTGKINPIGFYIKYCPIQHWSGYGTMKYMVKELVDLMMERRKTNSQIYIYFNHFALSRGLVLAGNPYVFGRVVRIDLSGYLRRHMQNYIPQHIYVKSTYDLLS